MYGVRKCFNFILLHVAVSNCLALNCRIFTESSLVFTKNDFEASLVAQLVKNPPAILETLVRFLGWEGPPGEGIGYPLQYLWASLVAQTVKNPPAVQKTWV